MRIGVLNMGSATAKAAVAEVPDDDGPVDVIERLTAEFDGDRDAVIRETLQELSPAGEELDGFAHRVVHGGTRFTAPTRIDDDVISELEELAALAPGHNPAAVEGIRIVRETYPELADVAVFDTAFHASRHEASLRVPLPAEVVEEHGLRRFGFHGIAHEALVESLARETGRMTERVHAITLQLGAGCSACAVEAGRSVETSMGLTPAGGLMMSTRSGDVDPGVLVVLARGGLPPDRLEEVVNKCSGLLGVGGSGDMREVLERESGGDRDAELAVRLFVRRVVQRVGAYLTLLDGRGALVFGGGIGTNSPEIRRRVAEGLSAWNVRLDPERNEGGDPGRISAGGSRPVYAFRTDEARVIARKAAELLALAT